jgi:hypothetical protein
MRSNYPTREIGKQVDYEALKRHGFQDQGIVVVSINDPRLSWDQREMIKQVGEKLYGQNS